MSVEERARDEVNRRHPQWHDNGVGIGQAARYRSGFVEGAVWQASQKANSEQPHSRACGYEEHKHGGACHANCPTCQGLEKGLDDE
jgi:hypothetical protein